MATNILLGRLLTPPPLATIIRLLLVGCPPTICRRIIPIIINPIKSISLTIIRWIAHISQKRLEIVPAFADYDSTTTVEFPRGMIRIRAPGQHSAPYDVKSRVCHIMLERAFAGTFYSKTTATMAYGLNQICADDILFDSTIASTPPNSLAGSGIIRSRENLPPVKFPARQIKSFTHESLHSSYTDYNDYGQIVNSEKG